MCWYAKLNVAYFCIFGTFKIVFPYYSIFLKYNEYLWKNSIKLLIHVLNAMSYINPENVKRKNLAKNDVHFFENLYKSLVWLYNCKFPGNFEILYYKYIKFILILFLFMRFYLDEWMSKMQHNMYNWIHLTNYSFFSIYNKVLLLAFAI